MLIGITKKCYADKLQGVHKILKEIIYGTHSRMKGMTDGSVTAKAHNQKSDKDIHEKKKFRKQ